MNKTQVCDPGSLGPLVFDLFLERVWGWDIEWARGGWSLGKTGEVGEPPIIDSFLQTDCHTVDTVLPTITGGKWYDGQLGSLRLVRLVNHPSLIPSYKLIVIQWTQYYQQLQEVSDVTESWGV